MEKASWKGLIRLQSALNQRIAATDMRLRRPSPSLYDPALAQALRRTLRQISRAQVSSHQQGALAQRMLNLQSERQRSLIHRTALLRRSALEVQGPARK